VAPSAKGCWRIFQAGNRIIRPAAPRSVQYPCVEVILQGILRMPRQRRRIQEFERSPAWNFYGTLETRSGSSERIFRTRARASRGPCFYSEEKTFGEENVVRGEISEKKRKRGSSLASIDDRVAWERDCLSCAPRIFRGAIFLNSPTRVYRRRNLPRFSLPSEASVAPRPQQPPSSTETFFHPFFSVSRRAGFLSRFTRASKVRPWLARGNDRMYVLW